MIVQSLPTQIQARIVSAYNAQPNVIPANTGPGASLGAVINALVTEFIDLQQQAAYADAVTRLQTSASTIPGVNSPDVDTFVFPFGITRNPAVSATGTVTFGAPSVNATQLLILVGTYVQTAAGIQYTVIADSTQPSYNASLNGYVIAIGAQYTNATVQAVIPGISGNAQAGTITQILSLPGAPAPVGVSTVTNSTAYDDGAPIETDQQLIQRFQNTMASRWATPLGVYAGIEGLENGLTFQVGDLLSPSGASVNYGFCVIVNVLGTNTSPPQSLLTLVNNNVQTNRPLGMPYQVIGPTLLPVNVSATLTLLPSAVGATVVQNAITAVQNSLNSIGLADEIVNVSNLSSATTTARWGAIYDLLYNLVGVSNVSSLTLNGNDIDIIAPFGTEIVSGSILFTTQ